VSYLAWPLIPPGSLRNRSMFSNRGLAQEMPRALNGLGYRVDVVNFNNRSWQPSGRYDVFVGHAGENFTRLAAALPRECPKIYFATGAYWKTANIRLAGRALDLARRTGHVLPCHRAVDGGEEAAHRMADGVVCLGGSRAAATFPPEFAPIVGINNAVFPVVEKPSSREPHQSRRRHFLFFNGGGNLLKGLDVLVEAFAGSSMELHVCQALEPEFVRVYRPLLAANPNIHLHGFIRMRSSAFLALASRCAWAISATCTEGQPGAILECMAHGLVPVLPDEANIDVAEWGIRLGDCKPDAIQTVAELAAAMPEDEYRERAEQGRYALDRVYSPERFRSDFSQAIEEILRVRERAPAESALR